MNEETRSDSMAVFCDFENVALGVRDADIERFDIRLVLEKLLFRGSILVKKAYCDWSRYRDFKPGMHEASFELIDIPHVRQSGKNSADIRLVVDALDLCYTKPHVGAFVIISGDSDFSPLVSKLRENAKTVIGVGVKNSTSDLLISNCDDFIFYDDLVRAAGAGRARPPARKPAAAPARKGAAEKPPDGAKPAAKKAVAGSGEDLDARRQEGVTLVVETARELLQERGGKDLVWGSMVKQTLKRRRPGFNETYHGFKSFNALLEEAQTRGLIQLRRDDKSGGFVIVSARQDD